MAFNPLDLTLPTGISSANLICLYQFDDPSTGILDRSGNGYNLNAAGQNYYTRGQQGEILWQAYTSDWYYTNAFAGVFNTLGALTVEWVGMQHLYADANMFWFCIGDNASTSEALNVICAAYVPARSAALGLTMRHESGLGVDINTPFQWTIPFGGLHHIVLTRAADGVTYKFFSDGELLETIVASGPPTGGTGSIRLYLQGGGSTGNENSGYMNSFRYLKDIAYSEDQVAESYGRIHV